jgi:hypothetical protein
LIIFLRFLNFLRFLGFLHTHTHGQTHIHTLLHSHTHILTLTYSHSHTHIHKLIHSHTHTLIHIRLIRVIVSIRYNGFRDSSCKWNSEVKRARPIPLWGWVTEREVIVSVWIEVIEGVIKWSKKSYMHSFSFYLGFYNFKIFWTFFDFFWNVVTQHTTACVVCKSLT